jgi:acyl-coenzyme A thioesterase PaaI-like protein
MESMIADGIIDRSSYELLSSTNCLRLMEPNFIEYVVGQSLVYSFPVLEMFANPRKSMQGGFIAAAFDNVFGALVGFVTNKIEMASVDISVNYIRPIFVNDILTIYAYIKSQGKSIVHLTGEAFNKENKLIATASINIMLLKKDKYLEKV